MNYWNCSLLRVAFWLRRKSRLPSCGGFFCRGNTERSEPAWLNMHVTYCLVCAGLNCMPSARFFFFLLVKL